MYFLTRFNNLAIDQTVIDATYRLVHFFHDTNIHGKNSFFIVSKPNKPNC